MLLLSFLVVALPVFLIFLVKNCGKVGWTHNHPPGPPGLPVIGNLYQFDQPALHQYLRKLSNEYGPLMCMKLGFRRVLVISSANVAREALKVHDLTFSSRPSFLCQQKISYNRLDVTFSPYGDYWREIRKICVIHLFSPKKVQCFRPIREDEVCRMINHISEVAASSSKIVNLSEIMMFLSSSIICRVGFGKRYDEKGHERKRFEKLVHEAEDVLANFFVSDFLPVFGWIDKVNGKSARLEKIFNELDVFHQELIEEHLSPNRPKSMEGDILDILIGLRDQNSSSLILTWDHIKAVLMDIFVAGTGTSAATIVWAMTTLMKEPRAMRKLQECIRELVGNKGRVDEDDIQKLPYLKAVVKETLRLYPPAPLLVPRETMEKCTISGFDIQPKTLVFINAWAIGRDPECWEKPDDFFPERFSLDNNIEYKSVDFDTIPFGAGRRGCPGISLGVATVELALANLLYAFDWELPFGMVKEDIDTDVSPGLTMHKKNPLCLVPKLYCQK